MKKIVLLLFSSLFSIHLFGGNDDKILAVVNKWNELHNTHNSIEFLTLYAPKVLFYGKQTDITSCYNQKVKFFKSEFKQEIITPFTLTYYSSGTVKCDFTKRTRTAKGIREHLCYLLLNKINGKYLITGESDLVTDQNKNVSLNLGNEKFLSKQLNFKYWTLLGIILIAVVIFLYTKRMSNNSVPKVQEAKINTSPPVSVSSEEIKKADSSAEIVEKVKAAILTEIKDLIIPKQTVKDKGDDFEKYVVDQFEEKVYKIYEWRSDKYHNGRYALSSMLPDLEYECKTGYQTHKFAIECKWRAEFKNDEIEWARPDQLNRYREYEKNKRIPVFILIGLGGKPSAPDHLFVIPLQKIYTGKLNKYQLQKFERKTHGTFDYDPIQNMLY